MGMSLCSAAQAHIQRSPVQLAKRKMDAQLKARLAARWAQQPDFLPRGTVSRDLGLDQPGARQAEAQRATAHLAMRQSGPGRALTGAFAFLLGTCSSKDRYPNIGLIPAVAQAAAFLGCLVAALAGAVLGGIGGLFSYFLSAPGTNWGEHLTAKAWDYCMVALTVGLILGSTAASFVSELGSYLAVLPLQAIHFIAACVGSCRSRRLQLPEPDPATTTGSAGNVRLDDSAEHPAGALADLLIKRVESLVTEQSLRRPPRHALDPRASDDPAPTGDLNIEETWRLLSHPDLDPDQRLQLLQAIIELRSSDQLREMGNLSSDRDSRASTLNDRFGQEENSARFQDDAADVFNHRLGEEADELRFLKFAINTSNNILNRFARGEAISPTQ